MNQRIKLESVMEHPWLSTEDEGGPAHPASLESGRGRTIGGGISAPIPCR